MTAPQMMKDDGTKENPAEQVSGHNALSRVSHF